MNLKINILTKIGFTNLVIFFFSMINFIKSQKHFLMAVAKESTKTFYELKWR